MTEEKKTLVSKIEDLAKEYELRNKEHSALGFFKFSEIRAINRKLEQLSLEQKEAKEKLLKTDQDIAFYENAKPSEPEKETFEDRVKVFSDEQLVQLFGEEGAKEYIRKERADCEKQQYGNSMLKYRIIALFKATLRPMTEAQLNSICQYYWSEFYASSKYRLKPQLRYYRLDGRIKKLESGSTEYFVFQK